MKLSDYLTETRRVLHRCPESGNQERQTADVIRAHLARMGIACKTVGETAVVGTLRGAREGRTVAIRADMDGLPVVERTGAPYASQNEGMMHACGHDAHMAILLGTAMLLQKCADLLTGTVVLIFEPAEETTGGAKELVRAGCLRGVDAVLGLHVDPELPVGQVMTRHGALYGASDGVNIAVRGAAAHGAAPEKGVDALVAAAQLVCALQTLVSRGVSPQESVALSFGTVRGGSAHNVLAECVELRGTLRTANESVREAALEKIERMAQNICAAFGASAEVEFEEGTPALVNDGRVTDLFLRMARETLGEDNVLLKEKPGLGVEDFSYFLREVPGVFFHLGSRNEQKGIVAPLHSPAFNIDEDCLPLGVLMESAMVLRLLREGRDA